MELSAASNLARGRWLAVLPGILMIALDLLHVDHRAKRESDLVSAPLNCTPHVESLAARIKSCLRSMTSCPSWHLDDRPRLPACCPPGKTRVQSCERPIDLYPTCRPQSMSSIISCCILIWSTASHTDLGSHFRAYRLPPACLMVWYCTWRRYLHT